jgi:hypothetical protein
MKFLPFLLLSLALLTGSIVAGPVEDFCKLFAAGAEVRVYRGFPERGYDKSLYEAAQKAGCVSLLGQVFYPELKTLDEKGAADWLAQATNSANYYPAASSDAKLHADLGFWCVTPDHKNEAYCLVSYDASQAHFWVAGKEITVAMTLDLETVCRSILRRVFEQELKAEKPEPAQRQ